MKSLCRQDPVALREAVEYLEGQEPRLAVCQSCWGAFALLSRRLSYRRQQLRKRQLARGEAARARASGDRGTSMVDGGGEAGCGGGGEGGGWWLQRQGCRAAAVFSKPVAALRNKQTRHRTKTQAVKQKQGAADATNSSALLLQTRD